MLPHFSHLLLFIDVETVGLNGPCKLIQYAFGDSKVQMIPLKRGWESNAETVEAVRAMLGALYDPGVCAVGFNIGFDLGHLYRVAHTLAGINRRTRSRVVPPFLCKVKDLLIEAQLNGPFAPWAFSKRGGGSKVRIGKVPTACIDAVVNRVLEETQGLVPAHAEINHSIHEVKGREDLKSVSFSVACSLSLKAHMKYWGEKTLALKEHWPLPDKNAEKATMHLPYATEFYNELEIEADKVLDNKESPFWKYAEDDIVYTRRMYSNFNSPATTHHDATVAAVAYTRYVGIPVDRARLEVVRGDLESQIREAETLLAGTDLQSPKQRLALLKQWIPFIAATNKKVLEKLANAKLPEAAAKIINAMLNYGRYQQQLRQVIKALDSETGRLHVDLKVVGTSTARLAGTSGFNIQGVSGGAGLRTGLLAAMVGDFTAFEVTIAAAVWADQQLLKDLTDGVDLHLMSAFLFHPKWPKGLSYEDAIPLKKDKEGTVAKCRQDAKVVVFAILYGAEAHKVASILGITESEALVVLEKFFKRYPGVRAFRTIAAQRYLTGDVEKWAVDSVSRMETVATDLTGFSRHWDFERALADRLWRLASKRWALPVGEVIRQQEKGPQSYTQAVRSSLLGAALGIQKAVFRQAVNMPIQATGANLTKQLMAHLWEIFHIPMLNVHDEIVFITHENLDIPKVKEVIELWIKEKKAIIPHIGFDLKEVTTWSEK